MKVLYGTTNQAKVDIMKRYVKDLDLEIISLKELNQSAQNVDESGKSPLENAFLKAKSYFEEFKMPVFSCDSGLYFENLSDDSLQPGTHIRRVNGRELNDQEMIDYYGNLAKRFNGKLVARYKNAISFIYDKEHIYNSMDDSLGGKSFLIVDKAHKKSVKGVPLDSLSVDINTEKYYFDIDKIDDDQENMKQAFNKFFKTALYNIVQAKD